MSYGDPRPLLASGCLKTVAWACIGLGIAGLAFLAWHQSIVEEVWLEERWVGSLMWFFVLATLEAVAIYTAVRGYYGVSVAFGGFVAAIVGLSSLGVLAGIGM